MPPSPELAARFRRALDTLASRLRADRTILAMVLCGSLSHDTVWEKSDIDLMLVTIDDPKLKAPTSISLTEESVNIHVCVTSRAEFRQLADGSRRHSFVHSFLAKGTLIYSHDPAIEALMPQLQRLGSRDTEDQLLRAGIAVLGPWAKAQKWFTVRGDLHYAALWILHAATPLAQIEVCSRGLLVDREVLPQALKLNPKIFGAIYTGLFDRAKTARQIESALELVAGYLRERRDLLFRPILDYLRDAGEIRSATEIENEFQKQRNLEGATAACEYLSDEGVITKASVPVKLTRRSNVQVNELAFVHLGEPPEF